MTIKPLYPSSDPTLDLNFAGARALDPRVTFTRSSVATRVGPDGLLQTVAPNVARFDHSPTTRESLGLLVEEQRTNSVTNNTMVGAVAGTPGTLPTGWGIFVSPTGLTRTIVGSGTVNGINYIDVRFNGTPSSTGEISLYLSPITTATLAQAWTATAWLSLVGGSTSNIATISLRNFELNSGAYVRETGTNFVSSISSDFVRRQNITTSFGASANQIQLVLSINATASGTPIDITLRIGLPQLELGAFATSVIPTTTAAATRAADLASITGTAFSSWYQQDEGTMFAEGALLATATGPVFVMRDPTAINRHQVALSSAAIVTNNVVEASLGATYTAQTKSSFAYALNDAAFVTNLTALQADTSCLIPTGVVAATIGKFDFGGGQSHNGHIRRLTYWPRRLPNAMLQAITS